MEKTVCPMCGAEIDKDAAVCPECSAPLDALTEDDSAIDNSEAIEAMLKSASKLMQDSAEEFSFDDDAGAAEKAKEVELSDEQKQILDKGGVVELSTLDVQTPTVSLSDFPDDSMNSESENTPEVSEPTPEEPPIEPVTAEETITEEPAEPEKTTTSEKTATENKPRKKEKKQKEPKPKKERFPREKKLLPPLRLPKKPKPKKVRSVHTPKSGAFSAVLIAVAFAVGIAGGFFIRMLTNQEIDSQALAFAKTSAAAVQSTFGEEETLVAYECFVRYGSEERECLIYGGKRSAIGTYENQWFRAVIKNDSADIINVYFELDRELYDAMKNSDDEKQIVTAAVMMSYEETLRRSIDSLTAGTVKWNKINCGDVNDSLVPESENSDAPDNTESAENTPDVSDVTDLVG